MLSDKQYIELLEDKIIQLEKQLEASKNMWTTRYYNPDYIYTNTFVVDGLDTTTVTLPLTTSEEPDTSSATETSSSVTPEEIPF